MREIVDEIFWVKWKRTRLVWCQNELECVCGVETSFEHSVLGATSSWGDSKGAEDVHKAERGNARTTWRGDIGRTRV